nr:immunoglobulin heavy chain junction region [Macaca mulatta]MOY23183.1 immunoglobulin heavy chain junction region [Macaca mulatta]MOY23190.1 immunoglobulin heavy chain junction region [Macaca mulatta]MOY23417.1 immunoglobulin heavy chain junction region [Macaca mulatta]MOY24178.1 immunoglobulin heavy chain junction region [Macaca mulatta]
CARDGLVVVVDDVW